MRDIDDIILNTIETDFKTVRQIHEQTKISYVRVSVRIRQMRKRNEVIILQSNQPHVKGVKPLKYKKKV